MSKEKSQVPAETIEKKILKIIILFILLLGLTGCDGGGCPVDSSAPALQSVAFSFDDSCKLDENHYLSVEVTDVKTNTPDCNWDEGSVIMVAGTYALTQEPDGRSLDPLRIVAGFDIGNAEVSEDFYYSCSEPLETGTGAWIGAAELTGLEPGGQKYGIRLELEGLIMSTSCAIETCVPSGEGDSSDMTGSYLLDLNVTANTCDYGELNILDSNTVSFTLPMIIQQTEGTLTVSNEDWFGLQHTFCTSTTYEEPFEGVVLNDGSFSLSTYVRYYQYCEKYTIYISASVSGYFSQGEITGQMKFDVNNDANEESCSMECSFAGNRE